MNAEIRIGTSGFSYADWKGPFYPANLASSSFLEFYSEHFSCVEINFSYYRMPGPAVLKRMSERTPDGFLFTIKAFKGITHEVGCADLESNIGLFLLAVEPLARSGKLGCILLQFPASFRYTDENRLHLGRLLDALSGINVVVEFRRSDWIRESVFEGLRKAGAGFVCVDEPALKGLVPPSDIATSRTGYVRFHGRNAENWWNGDSASRYNYLYDEKELDDWTPNIEKLASTTDRTFIFMNNHWKGKAVENAVMLKSLLSRKQFRIT